MNRPTVGHFPNNKMLTKEQKIEAYKYCVDQMNEVQSALFICPLLTGYARDKGLIDSHDCRYIIERVFSEFWKMKPKARDRKEYIGWWHSEDMETRMNVLNKLITDLS